MGTDEIDFIETGNSLTDVKLNDAIDPSNELLDEATEQIGNAEYELKHSDE